MDSYRPSLWKRLLASVRFFRQGYEYKRSPLAWPDFRKNVPLWQLIDFPGYAEEGYAQNSLIYSAITYKARAVTAAPLRAYSGDSGQLEVLPARHKLSRLLSRPNPYQSGAQLMQLSTVYLNLAGNVYVYVEREGQEPVGLYTLRPDRVRIIPGERGDLKGYLYLPETRSERDGVPMLPQDLMHVKLPNPLDPLDGLGYGLSPVSALAQSGDVDNSVTRYLKTFFDRGTLNNLLLKFNTPLDDEQIASIRKRWQEIYGGTENWGKIGVLDDSGTVERLGMGFDEMGFGPIDERNESRILGPFGVPPILIGSRYGLARSTYSNYQEARRAFWQDTFVPELGLYESTFDYFLAAGEDISIRFDTSQVPALQTNLLEQIDGAVKLFSMGVPANLAVRTVGLQIEEIPDGDTGYLPMNLVPVGTPRAAPALPGAQPAQPKPKPEPDAEGQGEDESAEGQPDVAEEEAGAKLYPFRGRPQGAGAPRRSGGALGRRDPGHGRHLGAGDV